MIGGAIDESPLVAAIPLRQCSRSTYDGSTIEAEVIDRLVATARIDGVEPVVLTDSAQRSQILDLVVAGNGQQLTDPAFRQELKSWLRFNPAAAASSRDGLLSLASGNPSLPGWLGPIMFDLVVSKDGDNERVAAQIRSSSVEVAAVRKDLQNLLGLGSRRPSLIVRFGRGPQMPRSLRRPVEDVTVTT